MIGESLRIRDAALTMLANETAFGVRLPSANYIYCDSR